MFIRLLWLSNTIELNEQSCKLLIDDVELMFLIFQMSLYLHFTGLFFDKTGIPLCKAWI